MWRNYLKTSFRYLFKNPTFSFINIAGLTVGITCCLLIALFVTDELSYDKHHQHREDIYRVATNLVDADGERLFATSAAPYAAALALEYPELEKSTRIYVSPSEDKYLLRIADKGQVVKSFYENKGFYADSTFFDIFSYRFIAGNPSMALREPNTLVVSEELAKKLFGTASALNKTVTVSSSNGNIDYRISGIFRKVKGEKSHIDANFFMSLYSGQLGEFVSQPKDYATNNIFYTYVKLKPGADAARLQGKLPAFIEKYAGKDLKAYGYWKKLSLQPVTDIHLRSGEAGYDLPGGGNNITAVYILVCIALFTLLIACINFMNLSTARSARRLKEVGIRKVVGAAKRSLVLQFLGESLILSFAALLLALLAVVLIFPLFCRLTEKELYLFTASNWHVWLLFVALTFLSGLLAGSYPAFYLSSFQPVSVLKGKLSSSFSGAGLRRVLVVFQFVISIILITGAIVIWRQMSFLRQQPLGFKAAQQIVVPLGNAVIKEHYNTYKEEVRKLPAVKAVSGASSYPGVVVMWDANFYAEGKNVTNAVNVRQNYVDEDFQQCMEFKMLSGRFYSKAFPADTLNRIVLNESAVRKLGFTPQTAIGKKIFYDWEGKPNGYEVVGVARDYHFESLHETIKPYGFILSHYDHNYMIINAGAANMPATLAALERIWKTLNPEAPFEYSFMDQDFQRNYEQDRRIFRLVGCFTALAIFISCLGLFGLAAYAAEQRTKEIGVRKVLGASVSNIVTMLSKDFVRLVMIALLIAAPIAWYSMNRWLQDFAYRIHIHWWMLVAAGGIAVMIALLTVSFQSVRAAFTNPVKALKTE
jgi:putative ABC transport system permease protein